MAKKEVRLYDNRVYVLDRLFQNKSDATRHANSKRAKGIRARVTKKINKGWNYPLWEVFIDKE